MAHSTSTQRPPFIYLLVGGGAALYAWAVAISTFSYPGAIGLNYNAPGTDYMVFHTAVSLALRGELVTLYDPNKFTALLNRVFHGYLSMDLDFRPWLYPPSFLLLLLPFGLMGFGPSYVLFQLVTALAMLGGLGAAVERRALWVGFAALVCPPASISVISGQCTFLIVALLAGGMGLLDRRPALAGVLFGLLSFKPQFLLLVPVVLLARQAWRASATAAVTGLAMAAICLVLFGSEIWMEWFSAFTRSTADVHTHWFLSGQLWGESVYTCAYLLGSPPGVAEMVQIGAIVLAGGAVWRASRIPMASAPRAAVLLAAVLLAAPYSGYYDLLLLVAASGLFLSYLGARAGSGDWLLGLLIWSSPLFSLPVLSVVARFTPVLTVGLLVRILWHSGALRIGPETLSVSRAV